MKTIKTHKNSHKKLKETPHFCLISVFSQRKFDIWQNFTLKLYSSNQKNYKTVLSGAKISQFAFLRITLHICSVILDCPLFQHYLLYRKSFQNLSFYKNLQFFIQKVCKIIMRRSLQAYLHNHSSISGCLMPVNKRT